MQFVSDGAGERNGGGREGQEFASLSLKNVASPICPSALVHTRWSGRAGTGECSRPFFFLPLFPVYFAGLSSLSPHSSVEQKLNAVLSIALNHAVAI